MSQSKERARDERTSPSQFISTHLICHLTLPMLVRPDLLTSNHATSLPTKSSPIHRIPFYPTQACACTLETDHHWILLCTLHYLIVSSSSLSYSLRRVHGPTFTQLPVLWSNLFDSHPHPHPQAFFFRSPEIAR